MTTTAVTGSSTLTLGHRSPRHDGYCAISTSGRRRVAATQSAGRHPAEGGPGGIGASGSFGYRTHVEMVMGTAVTITVDASADRDQTDRAVAEACNQLHRADTVFSTWNPWSPVSRLRRGAARLHDFDDVTASQIAAVFELCWQIRQSTDGWFDPWAMTGGVDPTGLVKGWAIEQAVAVLDRIGSPAMVNGGGDIATCGTPSPDSHWRIGIRHPWRPDALAAVVAIGPRTRAVATSGSYERGSHFLDPHTKTRTRGSVASATVTGEDLAIADGLATAIAVGGRAALDIGMPTGYDVYIIGHGGDEYATAGFPFA